MAHVLRIPLGPTPETGPGVSLLERRPEVRDRLVTALAREGVHLCVTSRDERALRAILPLLRAPLCLVGEGGSRDFLRWLQRTLPLAHAVVLGHGGTGPGAEEARALGASWVDVRRTSSAQLAALLKGRPNLQAPLAAGAGGSGVLGQLSPREREVLAHVASGADNLTIAACLDISERTVRAHVSALYQKVGGENRAQLVLRGLELGA